MESPPDSWIQVGGKQVLYFGGTSYFGLHAHPEVILEAKRALDRWGIHPATSRTGIGLTQPLADLERLLSEILNVDQAMVFPSGYMPNLILAKVFRSSFGTIFIDENSHYSLVDAMENTGKLCVRFRHGDPEDLRHKMRNQSRQTGWTVVATDGVFPATGELAPLKAYWEVIQQEGGDILWVDDAHGGGVLGDRGRGSVEEAGLPWEALGKLPEDEPRIWWVGTLSKAWGGFGGVIPANQEMGDRIRKQSKYFEGASALPPALAAAGNRALQLWQEHPEWVKKLRQEAGNFRAALRESNWEFTDSPMPVVGMTLGRAEWMSDLHQALLQQGLFVPWLSSYSGVGEGGILRIALSVKHLPEHWQQLVQAMNAWRNENPESV